MSISVLGPTFEDLAVNVKKNISNISYIFVGRSAGYIGGSLLGGIMFDCMNPHLLLGFSMLATAFGMFAIPFCKQALFLTGLMSSIGMSMGVLDTGKTTHEASHASSALQLAAGAFVSPIIAKLLFGSDGINSSRSGTGTTATTQDHHPQIMWAYIVIGSFVCLISFLFFILYTRNSVSRDRRSCIIRKAPGGVRLLHLHLRQGLRPHAQPQAAGLNSLFWATFAACRGLAIFFAACVYPGTMILLSLVGTTVSLPASSASLAGTQGVLWFALVSMAHQWPHLPSGISWVEQYTTVTGHTAAVFVVGAALGEMVLPALVGFLLGKFPDHPLLMYLSLITATFTSILFPVMYKLASTPSDKKENESMADQWNDADFEVIEMDDTMSLVSSPSKASSLPDAAGLSGSSATNFQVMEPAGTDSISDTISLVANSPRCKVLLSLDREKRD
uniref:Major facilitator superfamily domain containing 4B n=1 Tax=Echeneis naucrates TaxID=173247 RepID=A0A665WIH6_ECHNA